MIRVVYGMPSFWKGRKHVSQSSVSTKVNKVVISGQGKYVCSIKHLRIQREGYVTH